MKVEKRDGTSERRILTGMIVDKHVLARVAIKWSEEGLFRSSWCNLVGGWCVDYYLHHERAPMRHVEDLYEAWASEQSDKDTVRLVERFLDSLSGEYVQLRKELNPDFLLDMAGKHFNRVRVERLRDAISGDLENDQLDASEGRINTFARVELGSGAGLDVLSDRSAMEQAFEEKEEPLIEYPGALGAFFRDALERDAFVGVMGPEKRGKTWWLLDLAWMGMLQGRKVAFFEVGDMSQNQIMRRFMVRAAKRPFKPTGDKPVKYPTYLTPPTGPGKEERLAKVDHDLREWKTPLTYDQANIACGRILKRTKATESLLKLSCHPNSSISVHGVRSTLQTWERQTGWTPDVVVVDYADILAPPHGAVDSRDAINSTWKALRNLSQSLHCLVITATQSDAASYSTDTMNKSNFSEDKRKFAHVTAMLGINQTDSEKAQQIMRLNWLALREGEFRESECVHVASCLELAMPAVVSTF